MTIPYRTRQILKRAAMIVLIAALVLGILFALWFFWLQRFVVYTKDGVVFDFSLSGTVNKGELLQKPEQQPTIPIHYGDEGKIEADTELTQMIGYYVDAEALLDMAAVRSQIQQLPSGTPVMVDVKDIYGSFFYSSAVGTQKHANISAKDMDALIALLNDRDLYSIARIPALRDYAYGLNHVPDGLSVASGGYLWADEFYCYWLNPNSEGTVNYLVQIISELKNLGFDEVVLTDFHFPDTDEIAFKGDKQKALATAANTLVTTCTTTTFAVSFVGQDAAFALPEGRTRLYLEGITASEASSVAQQTGIADPAIHVAFLTDVHDTRFDEFSVLRPLAAAH